MSSADQHQGADPGPHTGWPLYWKTLDEQHQLLLRQQSAEYTRNLESSVTYDNRTRVLDFGCGFGYVGRQLADKVGQVYLWDSSENMRCHARLNIAGCANVQFFNPSAEPAVTPQPRFDLILVNSVVQYMTKPDFVEWLVRWRTMLAPGGRIVISDLIPPDHKSAADYIDLLRFSARYRLLANALKYASSELARYWRSRQACPLTQIGADELLRHGSAARLSVRFLPNNLTHFRTRLTAVLSEAGPSPPLSSESFR